VILIDSNILLYSKFEDVPQNRMAHAWLEDQLNSPGRVGIPWQSMLAFLRLGTNGRIFTRALTLEAAWQQVVEWLSNRRVWIPEPTEDHVLVLGKLLEATHATGNLVPDAHLAALAIEHGLTLCSADSDFARFPGVDWLNPLAPGARE
jgi:toxin-antitoxin system PIN domain toxin